MQKIKSAAHANLQLQEALRYDSDVRRDISVASGKFYDGVAKLVRFHQWKALDRYAIKMSLFAAEAVVSLEKPASRARLLIALNAEMRQLCHRAHTETDSLLRNPDTRGQISAALVDVGASADYIDLYRRMQTSPLQALEWFEEDSRFLIENQVMHASGIANFSRAARFFAQFHLHRDDYHPVYPGPKELAKYRDTIAENSVLIKKAMSDLKEAHRSVPQRRTLAVARKALRELDRIIVPVTRLSAELCALMQASLLGKEFRLARVLVALDLSAGDLAREWRLAVAVASWSIWIALQHETATAFVAARDAARRPYNLLRPRAKKVSVKQLVAGNVAEGDLVEVTGVIRDLHGTRTRDKKLLTQFSIYCPGSSLSIRAVAIYEHLGHEGLGNSASIRCRGTFRRETSFSKGPALIIDRLDLAKQRQERWRAFIADAVRGWFSIFPNNHDISWSLRPQRREANEGLLTSGASELVFSGPFRSNPSRKG